MGHNGLPEMLQVEMLDVAEHVAMTDLPVNVETNIPTKGTLITRSIELKKIQTTLKV